MCSQSSASGSRIITATHNRYVKCCGPFDCAVITRPTVLLDPSNCRSHSWVGIFVARKAWDQWRHEPINCRSCLACTRSVTRVKNDSPARSFFILFAGRRPRASAGDPQRAHNCWLREFPSSNVSSWCFLDWMVWAALYRRCWFTHSRAWREL